MITAIREVRRAKGMTLDDVARACCPPTTPQTIGRLEMGTRTVSLPWLNRIAAALGCTTADLVTLPVRETLPVAALLGPRGAIAPRSARAVSPPCATPGML
ncbi:MAG TPA: helix-turn-helix transcriptional regulator, partial [Sphingomonas sanguinis]|nr:helix-turn-helix transcriptional regulator [Sphingomonas sanguinis]